MNRQLLAATGGLFGVRDRDRIEYLDLNGRHFKPPTPAWTVRYMLAVAQYQKSPEQVRGWLKRHSRKEGQK